MLLLPQLTFLQARGYDVRVACSSEGRPWDRDLLPFRPVDLAFPRSVRPVRLAQALAALPRAARQTGADVVHLHTPAAALPARMLPAAAFGPKVQIVYTVHGFAHQWDSSARRDIGLERLERLLARRTDLMLFQSREDLARATAAGYRSLLRHLGNGVEDAWFDIPAPPPVVSGPTLLFVGRLVAGKGILELLEALRSVPGARLLVAGGALASDREQVADQVAALVRSPELAGRVELLGLLDRPTLMTVMERAHALVLPSHREGLPRSVIESLAAGRPAVVTDIRGCRELVTHEDNGLIVAPRDPVSLGGALRRLADEPGLLARLSARARPSVDPERRESSVFDRLVLAYREIGVAP